jgi:hypothetical protein
MTRKTIIAECHDNGRSYRLFLNVTLSLNSLVDADARGDGLMQYDPEDGYGASMLSVVMDNEGGLDVPEIEDAYESNLLVKPVAAGGTFTLSRGKQHWVYKIVDIRTAARVSGTAL